MRYELDSNARRDPQGTALFGGSPFRLIRLSPAGARMVDAWLAAEPVEMTVEATALAQRLQAAGVLHPVVEPAERDGVGFVLPVFDDAGAVEELLRAVRAEFPGSPVIVVDDASADSASIAHVAASADAALVRHEVNRGPAAARNTGWRALPDDVDLVVFIDSDVMPVKGAIPLLLGHLEDCTVSAAAPRIRARSGHSMLDRYEVAESPLDLGASAAVVRPGSSVPYVPTTLLAMRVAALTEVDGFDEDLRVGEDVDCIWRVVRSGGLVRYEPRALAHHRNRSSWTALLHQRHGYGSAAAELERRHPGDVAPIELPAKTLLAWALAWLGGSPGLGIAAALAAHDAAGLHRRLAGRVTEPARTTWRLSMMSHAHAGRWLARAITRVWLPIFVLASPFSQRARRVVLASAVLPGAVRWWQRRPAIDPVSYLGARMADDVAYGSGVWRGMLAERSFRALLPRTARRGN